MGKISVEAEVDLTDLDAKQIYDAMSSTEYDDLFDLLLGDYDGERIWEKLSSTQQEEITLMAMSNSNDPMDTTDIMLQKIIGHHFKLDKASETALVNVLTDCMKKLGL